MSWLATWSADTISRYKVHATGRTSHEWITGRRCDQPIAGFAETVHFKFTTDTGAGWTPGDSYEQYSRVHEYTLRQGSAQTDEAH